MWGIDTLTNPEGVEQDGRTINQIWSKQANDERIRRDLILIAVDENWRERRRYKI